MTSTSQPTRRRPAGRGLLLLVLAVLAGVLAMHGLGPGVAPSGPRTVATGGHGAEGMSPEAARAGAAHPAGEACSHTSGGTGHALHADATCAATGVASPYAPPAPAPALDATAPDAPAPGTVTALTGTGRAPPDPARLQLLRI
ncbi:DUF6153 family protein [Streptomyces sp. NPDC060048]|uniref:DUF6153 family protein n=1 Tax=unclassified Streptomyces TaxID=2593676 RepID=UPI0036AEF066